MSSSLDSWIFSTFFFWWTPPWDNNQIERKISGTQEVWILLRGKIKFEIFDIDNLLISFGILFSGDSITLFRGGHSLEVLEENTIFYEIKNGPYLGINKDKKQLDE